MVVLGVIALVVWAGTSRQTALAEQTVPEDLDDIVLQANSHLQHRWETIVAKDGKPLVLTPAEPASDLQILRRLSLSLHGTIPSLEEIRQFESDQEPQKLKRWTLRFLDDSRFSDYFAERLARGFVSTEGGSFIIYRRDRFVDWLRVQLKKNRPYHEIVREMIASKGLWTGDPATNFMTVAYNDKKFDVNKLAGRSVRAFLGQRLDCAQCHDHPFNEQWKQHHFEGLAAFFAQSRLSVFGVEDKEFEGKDDSPVEYVVEDRKTLKKRTVKPAVPFLPELLPEDETRRKQLAAWITHPKNHRFERAFVNRVWALLFGKAYTYPVYPVDDLPSPGDDEETDTKLLDLLGKDFREHNYDIRRLILVITSMQAFRMSSSHPLDTPAAFQPNHAKQKYLVEQHENNWAVFPLARLRPEQIVGSILQSGSIKTIDQYSNLFVRIIRYMREQDFVSEYGDPGDEELVEKAGTIPQSLLRMNGKLPNEVLKAESFNASGRIVDRSDSDENRVEVSYLVGLCRRPTESERTYWLDRLRSTTEKKGRNKVVEDLFWAIYNSPEFSWNH